MTDLTTDRRTFLRLLGAGGAVLGAGALGAFDSAAHAAAMDAITLGNKINQLVVGARGSGWNWAEQCQRAQYYAEWAVRGTESGIVGYDSAIAAYHASTIVSTDMAAAPAGSFSYYNKSSDGHVVTNIGNGYCINTSPLMANNYQYDFGRNLRITRLADYYPSTYLGWSYRNGTNAQLAISAWSPGGSSWAFNPPAASMQARIQQALKNRGRYSGPVDGAWGVNSIKGIQTTAKNVGYSGPINGVPGANTCHYVQVYAARFGGYTGPIDSVLGPNSWNGFAVGLEAP